MVSNIAPMRRAHQHTTTVLGALVMLLGVAMIVSTLARGGGPLSLGVVLGAAFTAVGAGRVYLARALRDEP
jgi:multisubunit Na+/H+ antiporter MnhG subunit